MFTPAYVVLDLETIDTRGASFEYHRKDFRLLSISLSWRDELGNITSWFSTRRCTIYDKLKWIADNQIPLVVFNIQYEYGCLHTLYPELKFNWAYDAMRLAILRDGGGDEFSEPVFTQDQLIDIELGDLDEDEARKEWSKKFGNSLEACARRFLPAQNQDHKKVAHNYLKEHHGITRDFGRHLHLLPLEQLRQYNIADTETTLLIFDDCVRFFKESKFNYDRDTQLYNMRATHMAAAYARGLGVNQESLFKYILEIEQEIKDIEATFYAEFASELRKVRKWLYLEKRLEMLALKTEKNRQKRWEAYMSGQYKDKLTFNFNSSARHLPMLFLGVLKIKPKFRTAKGRPSFKSSHLLQWGRGGEILLKRQKRLLVLNQAVAIYVASLYDGKLHASIKAAGTRTNRVSAGR